MTSVLSLPASPPLPHRVRQQRQEYGYQNTRMFLYGRSQIIAHCSQVVAIRPAVLSILDRSPRMT